MLKWLLKLEILTFAYKVENLLVVETIGIDVVVEHVAPLITCETSFHVLRLLFVEESECVLGSSLIVT